MIVAIDGKCFDTDKAKHWQLSYNDGRDRHTGDLYLSSKGTWYINTPSQLANGHRWELIDPTDAIARYSKYLDREEIEEILALAKLETE